MAVSNILLGEQAGNTGLLTLAVQQMDLNGNLGATKATPLGGAQGVRLVFAGAPVGMSCQVLGCYWNGTQWVSGGVLAVIDSSSANPGTRLTAIVANGNYYVTTPGIQAIALNYTAFTSGTSQVLSTAVADQAQS